MKEKFICLWAYTAMLLTVGTVLFLFAYIFVLGRPAITWEFLTGTPKGSILGSEGGILPAIVGSLLFTLVACVFGGILGIATALYLVFYCKSPRLTAVIQTVIQCIAGVPSIVLGLFGYSMLVMHLGIGRCLLAGGITQGIMVLPFIEIRAEKVFREFPQELVNAAYALGVSQAHVLRTIVLPGCRGGLVSGVILGACYAMGAAAPLIFTGAVVNAPVPRSLLTPAMALPNHLYALLTQGISTTNAYGTAFVLMAIVLVSNLLATVYANGRSKKWK